MARRTAARYCWAARRALPSLNLAALGRPGVAASMQGGGIRPARSELEGEPGRGAGRAHPQLLGPALVGVMVYDMGRHEVEGWGGGLDLVQAVSSTLRGRWALVGGGEGRVPAPPAGAPMHQPPT